eukprot:15625348-Heterocapsa_arctica.AAC.1
MDPLPPRRRGEGRERREGRAGEGGGQKLGPAEAESARKASGPRRAVHRREGEGVKAEGTGKRALDPRKRSEGVNVCA